MTAKISLATMFVAALLSCGCSESGQPVPIGDGFFIDVRHAAPTLHVPGNAQLWRVGNKKPVPVWFYLSGDCVATNGICLFNGGLADGSEWQSYPALLAYREPGPVVEITEILTRHHAEETGGQYDELRGKYVFLWPGFTNGSFVVKGNKVADGNGKDEWIEVALSTKELIEIIESVKKTGVKRKYRGIEYRIADPVEPSDGRAN